MNNNSQNLAKKLNHQIKFLENQRRSEIEDENWLETITTFAEIIPLSDTSFKTIENFNFGHVMTESYYIFRIRYNQRINNNMRISYNKKNFEIKRIINVDEKNIAMQIIVLEI